MTAMEAAEQSQLESWILTYLEGPANNRPFADGWRREQRYWHGPLELHLRALTRVCGPEPEMAYQVTLDAWRNHTSKIARSFRSLTDFPPLIVEYTDDKLLISDGNHRHHVFNTLGLEMCWVILWYPTVDDYEAHQRINFSVAHYMA